MKLNVKDTLFTVLISAVVTMVINYYEESTGKSVLSLLKDKLNTKKEGVE
jgi:hypothetical protein